MAYWVTREKEEPGNAFYQQGELANEAGCRGDRAEAKSTSRWRGLRLKP